MEEVARYYAARAPPRCPVCGSTDLVLDVERGQLVCRSCGYVVEDTVFLDAIAVTSDARPRREVAIAFRLAEARLRAGRAAARLARELGEHSAELVSGRGLAAPEKMLSLLRDPCIRLNARRAPRNLLAALLDALTSFEDEGTYPLYSELAARYGLSREEARRLKKLLRRVLECRGSEAPIAALAGAPR